MKFINFWLIIAIILVAINMRAPIIGVGVLLPLVQADLGFSALTLGLIGSIAMVAFALSSSISPKISQCIGLINTLFLASILIAFGIIVRSVFVVDWGFLVGTAILSLGISFANVLIPAFIKEYLPHKISQITGIYAINLSLWAGVAAFVSYPLAQYHTWQFSLGIWVFLAVLACVLWGYLSLILTKRQNISKNIPSIPKTNKMWHSKQAWFISFMLGLQSFLYYSFAQFLPMILAERGVNMTDSGYAVFVVQMTAVPSTLILARLVKQNISLRLIACVVAILGMIGVFGIGFLVVKGVWLWLWSVFVGISGSVIFALALMLFGLKTHNSSDTAKLSAMAQTVGYSTAIFGPLLTGIIYQKTGGFDMAMALLTGAMLMLLVFAYLASTPQKID